MHRIFKLIDFLLAMGRYSYRYSRLGYFLMKSYFSIFGGGRIGFSVIGTDSDGNPVYVGGLRGAVEGYVLRYYLTIFAYMDTLKIPVEQRFEKRMSQWYDLTTRYNPSDSEAAEAEPEHTRPKLFRKKTLKE